MKPTQELLIELKEIPAPELLLMMLFLEGNHSLADLKEFALDLTPPLVSDFSRALVNAPDTTDWVMLDSCVSELIDNEYPDLAVILEAEYERPDDDIP